MFLLVKINHYSSLGLKLGLVLVEDREAPYYSSQDQREDPFPSGDVWFPSASCHWGWHVGKLCPSTWGGKNRPCRRWSRCSLLRSEEELRTTKLDMHH